MPIRTKKDKRPLKRQELRYILFRVDQYANAPDKIKKDGRLHIGRYLIGHGVVLVACNDEAVPDNREHADVYPFFRWFKEAGAPICGKCERVVMKDIEANGLED